MKPNNVVDGCEMKNEKNLNVIHENESGETENKPQRKRRFFQKKPVRIAAYISLVIYPFFCWLLMELMNHVALLNSETEGETFRLFFEWINTAFLQVLFGLIVVYIAFLFIYALVKKAWLGALLFFIVTFVFGFVDYMKLLMHGDPFMPMDISFLGQANELASYVTMTPPWFFFVAVVMAVLWILFLFAAKPDCPGKAWLRYPILCILLVLGGFFISDTRSVEKTLDAFDLSVDEYGFLQRLNYQYNGFVCGFTMNSLSLKVASPRDYSVETMETISEPYSFTPSTASEPFDVFVVLSEGFFDIRQLEGLTFSENPLKNYDDIRSRENCLYGTMYSCALGGGTVYPEFHVLSGLTSMGLPYGASPYNYIRQDVETYITNYQNAGYRTTALHLYDTSFYQRNVAYEYIGFDEFIGVDEMTGDIEPEYARSTYVSDKTTEEAMEYYMEKNTADGTPSLVFVITIENHQPYGWSDDNTIEVNGDVFIDDPVLYSDVNTYTQGLKNADQMLGDLVSYIDSRERPTVLLFYGDHKPTLGEVHKIYEATGSYDSEDLTMEGRKKVYSTPFVIYANRDLSQGFLQPGIANEISDYHLLNAVAAATGFQQTPYMNFLEDSYKRLPYYNPYLLMDDTLTEEQKAYVRKMALVSYDRICGKNYSGTK